MNTKNKMRHLLCILLIAIMAVSCHNKNKNNAENMAIKESIFSVPLSDIQIENTTYEINAQSDTILTYKTGSNIVIPANAFLDKDGNQVKGNVKLTYREFTNAFDIYLGGIPMQYDSAGTEQVLETAGMIEINASSQGKPVFPNLQNKIQVQMNSFQEGNKYNVYKLDTVTGKWSYSGKDKVDIDYYSKSIASLPEVPPPPVKANQFSFTIGDNTGNYPELSIYKNVLFEPVDNKFHGFSGTEIKVKDLGKGIFKVTFIIDAYGMHEEESCNSYLAFKEGVDYDNAMMVYRNKYKTLIAKRNKIKQNIELQWKYYFDIRQKYEDAGLIDLFYKKEVTNLKGEEKITRTLQINGFGFINCDSPILYPTGAELLANYKDTKGNRIILNNIVLVEKGRNAIFRYTSKIKFNPQKENILWGITSDNKLAYLTTADFGKVTQISGEYTFTMKVYIGTLKTYEDVCKVLF
jgi:hypothetical protein